MHLLIASSDVRIRLLLGQRLSAVTLELSIWSRLIITAAGLGRIINALKQRIVSQHSCS